MTPEPTPPGKTGWISAELQRLITRTLRDPSVIFLLAISAGHAILHGLSLLIGDIGEPITTGIRFIDGSWIVQFLLRINLNTWRIWESFHRRNRRRR